MKKQLIAKLALIALGTVAGAAHADSITPAPTFLVKLTITKTCKVATAPSDMDLGSQVATATAVNLTGSTTFAVNCSKGTAFNIGMAPSAANSGDANGNGNMTGVIAGNTDKVPYALLQDTATGPAWGNTIGTNTKAGTGDGMAAGKAKSYTVFAKATNVDFTPDAYKDTVTVNITY